METDEGEGERSNGGEFALSPQERLKDHQETGKYAVSENLCYCTLFFSFYVFIVYVIGSSFSGGFSALLCLFIVTKINLEVMINPFHVSLTQILYFLIF